MNKPGVFYRGYNSSRDLPEIEEPVRNLVKLMNDISCVVTFCSCAGHRLCKCNAKRNGNVQIQAWIDFEVYEEEKNLENLFSLLLLKQFDEYAEHWSYLGTDYNLFENNLIWNHRLTMCGDAKNRYFARKYLGFEIKKMEDIIEDIIKGDKL